MKEAKCKVFEAYNGEWLEFIVASRKGLNPATNYDYIEGGIANDRVIDTVNLYIRTDELRHRIKTFSHASAQ